MTVPNSITLCKDGKYRWVYEFDMIKNPAILVAVYKVLTIGMSVPFLLVLISDGFHNPLGICKTFAILLGILYFVGLIAYVILAAIYGWRYCVLFTMDEKGIMHAQQPAQNKKAQILGAITAMAGAMDGNATVMGTGLLAASKSEQYSQFDKVKKIKVKRGLHLIKLDYLMSHNQIYVCDDAFDFVEEYILNRVKR